MWLAAGITSWAMFGLGVTLMTFILLRRSFRYQRRGRSRASSRPAVALAQRESNRDQPLMDAPKEVLRWQVEMHETARDLKGELDSKMKALQVLIQMAREQSERLETAIDRARLLGVSECRDTLAEIERLAEQAASCEGPALGDLPPLPEATTGQPVRASTCRELIYRLADQGHSVATIAEQAGVAAGEVEMILNLRPAMRRET